MSPVAAHRWMVQTSPVSIDRTVPSFVNCSSWLPLATATGGAAAAAAAAAAARERGRRGAAAGARGRLWRAAAAGRVAAAAGRWCIVKAMEVL
jgi:hypothetical protein